MTSDPRVKEQRSSSVETLEPDKGPKGILESSIITRMSSGTSFGEWGFNFSDELIDGFTGIAKPREGDDAFQKFLKGNICANIDAQFMLLEFNRTTVGLKSIVFEHDLGRKLNYVQLIQSRAFNKSDDSTAVAVVHVSLLRGVGSLYNDDTTAVLGCYLLANTSHNPRLVVLVG